MKKREVEFNFEGHHSRGVLKDGWLEFFRNAVERTRDIDR
jgi:hypothetical protein